MKQENGRYDLERRLDDLCYTLGVSGGTLQEKMQEVEIVLGVSLPRTDLEAFLLEAELYLPTN